MAPTRNPFPRGRGDDGDELDARADDGDDLEGDDEDADDLEGDDEDDGDDEGEDADLEGALDMIGGAVLGPPFAFSGDISIEEATAIVRHEDGRRFKVNLLTDRIKVSPHTEQRYTHALVIVPEDDSHAVADIVRQIMRANGTSPEELEQALEAHGSAPKKKAPRDIPEG